MHHHFGHAAGRTIPRALKDHVLHLTATQVLDTLLAQDPGNRVGDVALATAVRPDNAGYAFTCEAEVSMVREGLESCDFETLKLEHYCPSFDAGGDGHQRALSGRHYREMPLTCQQQPEAISVK